MFKFIKRFFGLDYNDDAPVANKHSDIGYMGMPNLADKPAVEGKDEILLAATGIIRPAVEGKGEILNPVKKAPKKPAAKKAAPKKAAPKKTAK